MLSNKKQGSKYVQNISLAPKFFIFCKNFHTKTMKKDKNNGWLSLGSKEIILNKYLLFDV
jgi:hypothetical protein